MRKRIISKIMYTLIALFVSKYTFASNLLVSPPPQLKNKISLTILKAGSGDEVVDYNGDKPRLVASNMKLVTTLVALNKLGPNFSWHTRMYYSGVVQKGVLTGQVYIKGAGDPTFSKDDLYNMLAQLKKLGIKDIKGDIVIDENIFKTLPTYSMLKIEPYDSDTIVPHGFMVDGDATKFTLNVKDGAIDTDSNLKESDVVNKLTLNNKIKSCDGIYKKIQIDKSQDKVTLSGSIASQCNGKVLEYAIFKHEEYLDLVINDIMGELGIGYNQVDDINIPGAIPLHVKLIVDRASAPLNMVLFTMNHYSINLIAESILLSLGAYTTKNIDTYQDAKDVYYNFMNEYELNNSALKLENGAGVSRTEYLTTNNLAEMLLDVDNSSLKDQFQVTLPSPESVGTLSDKFVSFGNRLQCKTGTLNDVKSYAGYFHSKTGQKYVVVFTANGLNKNSKDFVMFDKYVANNLVSLDKLN